MSGRIVLTRFREVPDQGIIGRFVLPNGISFYSMEQNWRNNAKGISCVPEGRYQLYLMNSPRFGPTAHLYGPPYEVYLQQDDVPAALAKAGRGRSHVLIHAANLAHELQGCIALGKSQGHLYSNKLGRRCQAILSSKLAIDSFYQWFEALNERTVSLEIKREL